MGVEVRSQRGQVRTRADADPQRALERRLKASAEKYYDPEIDIDWEAPIDPARPWLSPHRVALEGTELWESLTREQRLEFGRQQLGSILILGIWFETALAVFLYHDLMVSPVTGGRSRYLLTEIGEETRHSTMFARLVEKMGEDATAMEFRAPRFARGAVPFFSSLVPVGPAMYTAVLMAEEVLDRLQREGMNDPALQPHARAAMRIHVIGETRHVSFAKDEIVRGYRDAGPVGRFLTRVAAGGAALVFPALGLANPRMYRAIGVNPVAGMLTGFLARRYGENARFLFAPMARFFYDAGIIKGIPATILWRLSRALPEDVKAQLGRDGGLRGRRAHLSLVRPASNVHQA
ncbi:AurF N-oxygenase family protein [Mycobacteroides abscessus]|uniref:AurF N-oxygenase family protein n=1 Tax=Mycobacteroides abscessus TaxID=36809 RepID=UPI002102D875|nr:diiron oxygenase [Mycobacteroides abscessus]